MSYDVLLLQEMLGFTRHPYQQLSGASLGFWGALLREAGISFGAVQKSPVASPRDPAAAGSQGGAGGGQQAAAAGAGGASEGGAGRAPVMPPECCQVSMWAQQVMLYCIAVPQEV